MYLNGPPGNPFTRLLAGLVGVLAMAGAVFFGLFLFAAVIAVGLVAWAVIALRLWWMRRRLGDSVRPADPFGGSANTSRERDDSVIDADYEVVSREVEDEGKGRGGPGQ